MSDIQELQLIVQENNLPVTKVEELMKSFGGFFTSAKELAGKANGIKVTDESQTDVMMQAKELRLQIKNIRIEAEKTKITLKEQSLREGNAIQGAFNIIKALIVPVEEYLESQEKFAENLKLQKQEAIYQERLSKISPFVTDVTIYNIKDMSDYSFDQLLTSSKGAVEARNEALKKAEEDKIAQETADRKEQERIKVVNEELKANLLEAEKILAKEREEKLELENKIKRENAQKEEKKKAEEELKQKSLLAPDKEKLIEFAGMIDKLIAPNVASKDAGEIIKKAESYLAEVSKFVRDRAKTL